jgi:class 3 adenylate cyclase
MDIGAWLRGLGLGQYEAAFRESEIDADVLPELTETDLEKLGLPLGPRKRILKAIANLGGAEKALGEGSLSAPPPAGDGAERRQLTVMFCDLVGSTALSARLDPEDLREIIGAYHRCCANMVERNGGFVAKYMGDGVLAYFGYPRAHEHDAERAVQAGLALVEAAPKLVTAAGSPLHVRVGIATGVVVVGDLTGSGEAQERGVVGQTPNLAVRLQGIAEPGGVIIAEATRRLTNRGDNRRRPVPRLGLDSGCRGQPGRMCRGIELGPLYKDVMPLRGRDRQPGATIETRETLDALVARRSRETALIEGRIYRREIPKVGK